MRPGVCLYSRGLSEIPWAPFSAFALFTLCDVSQASIRKNRLHLNLAAAGALKTLSCGTCTGVLTNLRHRLTPSQKIPTQSYQILRIWFYISEKRDSIYHAHGTEVKVANPRQSEEFSIFWFLHPVQSWPPVHPLPRPHLNGASQSWTER